MIGRTKRLHEEVAEIVEACSTYLPAGDIAEAKDLVMHSEWGVALDLVCTQLYEYGISVNTELLQKIFRVAEELEVDVEPLRI